MSLSCKFCGYTQKMSLIAWEGGPKSHTVKGCVLKMLLLLSICELKPNVRVIHRRLLKLWLLRWLVGSFRFGSGVNLLVVLLFLVIISDFD